MMQIFDENLLTCFILVLNMSLTGCVVIMAVLAARLVFCLPCFLAVAGEAWLDFTLADKGTGMEQLCRRLNISLDQVAAFGDNFNDVPMLSLVGRPYIMDTAHPQLKERFPTCSSVEEALKKF